MANKEEAKKSRTAYKNEWQREHCVRVAVSLDKVERPTREQLQQAARAAGKSVNKWVLEAITEKMDREGM